MTLLLEVFLQLFLRLKYIEMKEELKVRTDSLLARGLPHHREREEEDTAEGVGGVAHHVRQEPARPGVISLISLADNCPGEVQPEEEVGQ